MGEGPVPLRRRLGRLGREATTAARILASRGAPRVMFFPWTVREMSSLLRVYNIADALRGMGWAAVVVPRHLSQPQRRRLLALFRPDAVVIQKGRHPLNTVEHLRDIPFVYDIDDADFLDPRATAREQALAGAARGVIAGSRFIADWYARFNPLVETVWTGGPVRPGPRRRHGARGEPILTWAQSDPLAYPRELDFVEAVALRVKQRRGALRLRLYGWRDADDHPRLGPLRDAGVTLDLMAPMPYDRFVSSLEDCAVGLSPVVIASEYSRGKSFGKILAYLDAQVPVICSDEVDHGAFFDARSGIVSNDPDIWVTETVRLLDDPARRDAMAGAAFEDYRAELSTDAAARKVDAFLRRAFDL